MPVVIVPNGYAEIGIEFLRTGATLPGVITFGVKLKAAPTTTQIATDIRTAWTAAGSMNGAQPTSVVAKFVRWKAVWGGVAMSGQSATTWVAGGGNPALASPAVSLVARKRTGLAGRKMRGRLMIPWCSEADIDANGNVAAGVVTAYNGGLSAFRVALAAAARVQVNGMYLLHSDATAPTLVATLVLRSKAGTQRTRQLT